jgi:hypothetical protein
MNAGPLRTPRTPTWGVEPATHPLHPPRRSPRRGTHGSLMNAGALRIPGTATAGTRLQVPAVLPRGSGERLA